MPKPNPNSLYQQKKDRDRDTLERAADMRRRFEAGIFPRGSGQHSQFQKLVRQGLLVFVGWGRDIDREVDEDVMIYDITPKGLDHIGDTTTSRVSPLKRDEKPTGKDAAE